MKKWLMVLLMVVVAGSVVAEEPLRVVLLDFENDTGMKSDAALGGQVNPDALAQKGVYLLSKQILKDPNIILIDRREFLKQMDELQLYDGSETSENVLLRDKERPTPTKPDFLQAAQALNADAVIRGSLMSFSTGKQKINQGGYQADFSTVSLRVGLEALDAIDGAMIAMSDGVAQQKFRQTANVQTILGEEDVLGMFEQALAKATPDLEQALQVRAQQQRSRPTVKLSIATSDDPAMVEIDGILVGSTPLTDYEVYVGDHVLAIGKPGYQDITKRIKMEKNTKIQVPMIRTELNAEELKEAVEKMRMHLIVGEPALVIETTD
jgi:hypothetical protein